MNRKIIFRGMKDDMSNPCFVYGSLITTPDGDCRIATIDTDGKYSHVSVIPNTVGQFVGLTDKGRKDIYEGDIIEVNTKPYRVDADGYLYKGVIKFGLGSFRIEFKDDIFPLDRTITNWNLQSEIIGNIHANPELLTTKTTTL